MKGAGEPGSALVLVCGQDSAGLSAIDGLRTATVPARPGKADVDVLLAAEERVVVAGTDADLAAVALRLLRTERLRSVAVGFIPSSRDSEVARLWRLPADRDAALRVALLGDVDPVPLIRDDAGGVLVGTGEIGPVRGVAYCDDETALRGAARRIVVSPDPGGGPGLVATVTRGMVFKRPITFTGRAFQLGCVPAVPVRDGVPYPRELGRWTWYRHTEDLRLVRGAL